MKVAICGYPPLAFKLIDSLKTIDVECTHFIEDLMTNCGEDDIKILANLSPVKFFEFRRLVNADKLDGLVIVEGGFFVVNLLKICRLYDIPNVYVTNFGNNFGNLYNIDLYNIDNEKVCIPYLETNLIDSCNLNCIGCTHFAGLFNDNDIYKFEDFRRDVKQLSDRADILTLRLMGGEPLKLKNLDRYLKTARQFLPRTNLRLATNGLLIPSTPQYILDSLRENKFSVDVSPYKPTMKIFNKIDSILTENKIPYFGGEVVEFFNVFMSLHSGHNPEKSRKVCGNEVCRFLRNGKIYKCPIDGLSYRFAEYFGLKNLPAATGIDIFAKNFSTLMEQLDGNIELCGWCNEIVRRIDWKPENNPQVTDWLADPSELEKLLPK